MGEAFNILPYVKTPDFVTPLETALRMHESRVNSDTQRMYAQNQMMRESAQEYRDRRDFEEKKAEKERADKLEAAKTIGTIHQMLQQRDAKGQPVNLGPAMALGSAYGIGLHPLLATTAAAHAAQGDAVDQALAEAGPIGNAPPAAPPAPPATVPVEGPEQDPVLEEARPFRVPAPASEGDSSIPRETVPSPELEKLMSSAGVAPKVEAAKFEAPTNPLYDAVMGGQHFQIGGAPSGGAGGALGPKYDALAEALIARGAHPFDAYKAALGEKEKDDAAAAMLSRQEKILGERNANTQDQNDKYRLSAEDQKKLKQEGFRVSMRNTDVNAAARAGQNAPRQEQADTGQRAQYLNAVKEAKAAAGAGKDIDTLKKIEKIGGELNSSSPAAQNAAVDTLAQIAQGGKASIAVMNVFQKHSIGPVESAADKLYQITHNGQHSPAYINSFKGAVRDLTEVANEQRGRAFQAFEHAAGSKSQFAQIPGVAPYVDNERNSFREELGLPPESKKLSPDELAKGSFLP